VCVCVSLYDCVRVDVGAAVTRLFSVCPCDTLACAPRAVYCLNILTIGLSVYSIHVDIALFLIVIRSWKYLHVLYK